MYIYQRKYFLGDNRMSEHVFAVPTELFVEKFILMTIS